MYPDDKKVAFAPEEPFHSS